MKTLFLTIKRLKHASYLYSLTAGIFLALSFAPISITGFSFISIGILFYQLIPANRKQAWWHGFSYGLGFFGTGVSWVYVSIHTYGQTNQIIALSLTLLFVICLSLYFAIFCLTHKIIFNQSSRLLQCFGFATLWVLFEYLRSTLFTGFPWLLLGYSQISTPLQYLAPIIGVYGLGFFVALSGTFLTIIFTEQAFKRYYYAITFLLIISLPISLQAISWTHNTSDNINVSAIQGNISQDDKWSSRDLWKIIDKYQQLSAKSWESELIVWPEFAIPAPYHDIFPYLTDFAQQASVHHSKIITGIAYSKNQHIYNAIVILGQNNMHYFKQHLVPFGEYIPLQSWLQPVFDWLNIPISNISAGNISQPILIAHGMKIIPFICYEIAYSDYLLKNLNQANLLITITDDMWFGHSFASKQHLEIARMRSLQSGRYQIFASNNGISALISPQGKILNSIVPFKTGILHGQIKTMEGLTPWAFIGNRVIIAFFMILLIILIVLTSSKHFFKKI